MTRNFTPVDDALAATDAEGYLVHADSDEPTQRYLSGFDAPDPFFTCYTPSATTLLVSGLEYGRAVSESSADEVRRYAEFDRRELLAEHGERDGMAKLVAAFLADAGVGRVLVPERFPVGIADALRDEGVGVAVDTDDAVGSVRAVKTETEIEHIRGSQAANETAMAAAEQLLAAAEIDGDRLVYDGEVLTSERVTEEIEVQLLREGYALSETIVACGEDAADPHDRGSGPLQPHEPIIIDVFPCDKETGYHGDMTRTFVVGEPSEEIQHRHELTEAAMEAALDEISAGTSGKAVHAAACEVYEEAGYPTFRTDPTTEVGFIHSTGHGVGLAVHESPSLSTRGEELAAGHVVTVEPGLYDPAVGGVRIEDLVVVTEDGYRNLTEYPVELVV